MFNIWKSKLQNNKTLFKPLERDILEFRTLYNKKYLRLFAFWDNTDKKSTLVVATHGIIKKTSKVPKKEIDKAVKIREEYLNKKT